MSEHCVAVVRVDALPPDQAERAALEIEVWLSDSGILGEPDHGEPPVLAPAGSRLWSPGPLLARQSLSPERPAAGLVAVTGERALHHAYANAEAPHCGRCGTRVADDVDNAAIGTWIDAPEPEIVCGACGWAAPYGDWPNDWPSVVGTPAVTFHVDADPGPELLARVAERLGGRTVVVHTHL